MATSKLAIALLSALAASITGMGAASAHANHGGASHGHATGGHATTHVLASPTFCTSETLASIGGFSRIVSRSRAGWTWMGGQNDPDPNGDPQEMELRVIAKGLPVKTLSFVVNLSDVDSAWDAGFYYSYPVNGVVDFSSVSDAGWSVTGTNPVRISFNIADSDLPAGTTFENIYFEDPGNLSTFEPYVDSIALSQYFVNGQHPVPDPTLPNATLDCSF